MRLKLVEHDLLLLPGIDGTGAMFAPFLSVLPAEFAHTTVLYPNHERYSYQQLLTSICSAYQWERPLIIVAESFAGLLALELAAAHPENVQAVVLVSSFVSNHLSPFVRRVLRWVGPRCIRKCINDSMIRHYFLGEDAPDELVYSFRKALLSVRPAVLIHRLREVLKADVAVALENCRRPILYLLAAQDRILGKRGWEGFSGYVTTTTLDGPHMLLQRKPREAFTAINEFVQSLATSVQLRRQVSSISPG